MTAISQVKAATAAVCGVTGRDLEGPSRKSRTEPTEQAWLEAVNDAAAEHRVRPADVLAGRKFEVCIKASHSAWRRVLAANPHVSEAGLARVSGFDHTTICDALRDGRVRPR